MAASCTSSPRISKMMAVEVKGDGKKFEAGVPKPLFEVRQSAQFDVSKDGRFLIHVPRDQSADERSADGRRQLAGLAEEVKRIWACGDSPRCFWFGKNATFVACPLYT